jgi:hypothetical protein
MHLKKLTLLVFSLAATVSITASVTASRTALGSVPLAVVDREDNCAGCGHDVRIIERWSRKHFLTSYAGIYYLSRKKRMRVAIGYTVNQSRRVRAVKQIPGLRMPSRIVGFPYLPQYSLQELKALEQRILADVVQSSAHSGLLIGVGTSAVRNRIDVGTQRVSEARELLQRLYGAAAPIHVRYEEAPVPLVWRERHAFLFDGTRLGGEASAD